MRHTRVREETQLGRAEPLPARHEDVADVDVLAAWSDVGALRSGAEHPDQILLG